MCVLFNSRSRFHMLFSFYLIDLKVDVYVGVELHALNGGQVKPMDGSEGWKWLHNRSRKEDGFLTRAVKTERASCLPSWFVRAQRCESPRHLCHSNAWGWEWGKTAERTEGKGERQPLRGAGANSSAPQSWRGHCELVAGRDLEIEASRTKSHTSNGDMQIHARTVTHSLISSLFLSLSIKQSRRDGSWHLTRLLPFPMSLSTFHSTVLLLQQLSPNRITDDQGWRSAGAELWSGGRRRPCRTQTRRETVGSAPWGAMLPSNNIMVCARNPLCSVKPFLIVRWKNKSSWNEFSPTPLPFVVFQRPSLFSACLVSYFHSSLK